MTVKFNDRSAQAVKKAEDAVVERIEGMLDEASELAKRPPPQGSPYLTGNNRDNIGWEPKGKGQWHFFTRSNYGAYLELGTSRIAARPYMKPALVEADKQLQGSSPWR